MALILLKNTLNRIMTTKRGSSETTSGRLSIRQERLAKALRANLGKRKMQERIRTQSGQSDASEVEFGTEERSPGADKK
jgi:hypothetical protein